MKFLIVCLALASVAYGYDHLDEDEVWKRCLVDKPDTPQGVAYVADSDCANFWQCDFADDLLYNITLQTCAIGALWVVRGTMETPPAPGLEKVVCIPCELQKDPVCKEQYPIGSKQCPYPPTQLPTTTEPYPDLGPRECVNPTTYHHFREIVGEVTKVWDLGANATYDCDYLLFDFDSEICNCVGEDDYPIYWPFRNNFNSFANRIFADVVPWGSVSLQDPCAEFNGTGGLQIPFFANLRHQTDWTILLILDRDDAQSSTLMYQVPQMVINLENTLTVTVTVKNAKGVIETVSVTVTLPEGVVYIAVSWDGYTLTVTVWHDGVPFGESSVALDDEFGPWALFFPPAIPLFIGYVPDTHREPGMPGGYSGEICWLYFTDRILPDPQALMLPVYP